MNNTQEISLDILQLELSKVGFDINDEDDNHEGLIDFINEKLKELNNEKLLIEKKLKKL